MVEIVDRIDIKALTKQQLFFHRWKLWKRQIVRKIRNTAFITVDNNGKIVACNLLKNSIIHQSTISTAFYTLFILSNLHIISVSYSLQKDYIILFHLKINKKPP